LLLYYSNWEFGYFSTTNNNKNNYTNFTTSTVTIASLDCFPVIPLIRIKSLDHLGQLNGQPGEVEGHWSPVHGLKMMSSFLNQGEKYDLEGAVLRVTTVVSISVRKLEKLI
jgi:hypothetical protein